MLHPALPKHCLLRILNPILMSFARSVGTGARVCVTAGMLVEGRVGRLTLGRVGLGVSPATGLLLSAALPAAYPTPTPITSATPAAIRIGHSPLRFAGCGGGGGV